jgi:hypothetical protein
METTRAYFMSHIVLRDKMFFEPKEFSEKLGAGPQVMKQFLADLWNGIGQDYFKEGTVVKDIDRKIVPEDFNITNAMVGDNNFFFFTMPEPDSYNAQAKCVALVASRTGNIRYITMEIWTEQEVEKKYTIGEWIFAGDHFEHKSLGKMVGDSIDVFASAVAQIVNENNKE